MNLGVADNDLVSVKTVSVADHVLVEDGAVDETVAVFVARAERHGRGDVVEEPSRALAREERVVGCSVGTVVSRDCEPA